MENSNENSSHDNVETNNDNRREFIKKYGKYAAITPIALTTLMAPGRKAIASGRHCPPGGRPGGRPGSGGPGGGRPGRGGPGGGRPGRGGPGGGRPGRGGPGGGRPGRGGPGGGRPGGGHRRP